MGSLKRKKLILIGIFLLSSILSYSFKLSNTVFNQRIDTEEGGYREFYVENQSLGKQRYRVNVLKGSVADISDSVEVYPKILTIEPKSVGILKVFVKAPKGLEKREYNFKLQFQSINIPTLVQAKKGKISGTSNVSLSPVIQLKGYVGEANFEKNIRFEDIKVTKHKEKGVVVTGILSNDSYIGIEFGAEAYGKNGYFYGAKYVGELGGNGKNKKITLNFPQIKDEKALKKILFYRTPSRTREVIKTIKL